MLTTEETTKIVKEEAKKVYKKTPVRIETTDHTLGKMIKIFVEGELKHNFIIDYHEYYHGESHYDFVVAMVKSGMKT